MVSVSELHVGGWGARGQLSLPSGLAVEGTQAHGDMFHGDKVGG